MHANLYITIISDIVYTHTLKAQHQHTHIHLWISVGLSTSSSGGGGGGGTGVVCPWAMECIGGLRVLMAVPIMPVGGAALHLACPG